MKHTHTHTQFKHIRQIIMFFVFFKFVVGYSQQYEINLSPEGKLETVYDNQGNQFNLKDILIEAPNDLGVYRATTITCSTTSYFNLYFEPGCGMENTSNPTHNARRAVICKVFEDISNFITSPLSTTGNKVNIWVRNIANENVPAGTLGLASSYYLPSQNVGGILDGEIWKTIHLGVDSYSNVSSGTNIFYHGRVSFNFNDPNINWNTNLAINSPSNLYDLYTVILHEVVHSLGFGSFINQNGASIDPFPYYSRYDTFLRTNNNIPLLTIGSCSMYDVSFNSAVSTTVLRPGCTLPNNISNGVLNTTICNNAIKYVGSSTVPVYTPTCFELGSSLSHFEDMLFPTCANPNGNDNYFVLSNANTIGKTKRFLKPEERNVLCDIGYNVKTTFGTTSTSSGYYNYGGTSCSGITVAGLNDGIDNSNGSYTFIGSILTVGGNSSNVILTGFLANDINAIGFQCLQSITAPTTTTFIGGTSGNNTTSIIFNTTTPGLHILRYVPVNSIGQEGNITYIYVYIAPPFGLGQCAPTPTACDLVMNGGFEQFSNIAPILIRNACGWNSAFHSTTALSSNSDPLYFNTNTTNNAVPCNNFGFQGSNNNEGNGYAGIRFSGYGFYNLRQVLVTRLKTPLQPITNYQLSFDVSLGEADSFFSSNISAYLSNSQLNNNIYSDVIIPNVSLLMTSQQVVRNTTTWDTITFNFTTTTGGEEFLYLGLLNNPILSSNIQPTNTTGCNYPQYSSGSAIGSDFTNYYIDNVSLIPTNGVIFDLPNDIDCDTQLSSDLTDYVSGAPANGTFSGNGIVFSPDDGTYSFNPQLAGNGLTTLTYTYTNANGCLVSINTVVNIIIDSPEITGATSICLGTLETFTADVAGGTWSTSNTTIADINPITGELDAHQDGVIDVIYTYEFGNCNFITQLQITIVDPATPPVFSFPTTICSGSAAPHLPTVSNNGISGSWSPSIVNNSLTRSYRFYPNNNCSPPITQIITVINGGSLVAHQDDMLLPYSPTGFLSPNILLNDTLNGNLLTSNTLGLSIILLSTTNGITINQDGTLNIPPDLPIGVYTIEYYLKNNCLQSNSTNVEITIYDTTIIADNKREVNRCYTPSAYTTTESIFDNVTFGGNIRADGTTLDVTLTTQPLGFSLNQDGTINIPANCMPGSYSYIYSFCPAGSTTGCVNDIKLQVVVETTIKAYGKIFTFQTTGAQVPGASYNIYDDDIISSNCFFSTPNNTVPVNIAANGNAVLSGPISYFGNTNYNNYFIILPNGNIEMYIYPPVGSYFFEYTICDILYPNICSTVSEWINVVGFSPRFSNNNNEINFNDLVIEPNPSDNKFTIHFNNFISTSIKVEVFNLLNQKVYSDEINNVNNYELLLNNLPSGTYLLKISNGIDSITKKIIKN